MTKCAWMYIKKLYIHTPYSQTILQKVYEHEEQTVSYKNDVTNE